MKRSPLLLLLILMLPAAMASAAEGDTASAKTPVEQLSSVVAYHGTLPAYSVDIEMTFSLEREGAETENIRLNGSLAMSGTDQARYRLVAPDETIEIFTSGEKRYFYLVTENQYIDASMLDSRSAALMAMPSGPFRGAQMILSDILHNSDDFQRALEKGTVALDESNDVAGTDLFKVDSDGLTSDFWTEQGEKPLLRKFALDLTEMASLGDEATTAASVVYSLSNWKLEPVFATDYFTFQIPEGATEFEPPQPEQSSGVMAGNPAPNIDLPLLGGGTLDLAALKGKNTVILDFWATWCGPCRVGLPIVSKVADQYKDKGVLFYAVNVGEDAPTIQAFLEQTELDMTVVLDTERVAQQAYGATGIPTTFVIDSQGIVREVHTGVGPTLEQDLGALLDELTE